MAPKAKSRRVTSTVILSLLAGTLPQAGCGRDSPHQLPSADAEFRSAPIIEFPTTQLDLGEVPANLGEPATASLSFRNVGGSPLRIEELTKDCLCASAEVVPPIVAPGSHGEVRLELRRESPRPSAATITLRSNDPDCPETQLSVKWHVVGPLEFEPVSLDLGNIAPSGSKTESVRLVHRFKATEPRWPTTERIDCEPADSLAAEVKSHTTIEASPSDLFLGAGRPGDTLEKALTVSADAGAGDLEISSVDVTPDDGTLSVVATSTSKRAIVFATKASLTGPAGTRRWDIIVSCSRPISQSLTVATSAYVQPTGANGLPE